VARGGSWQTVAHPAIGTSGTYRATGLIRGHYRIGYAGLTGPTVAAG
jgi:hypothetical protein